MEQERITDAEVAAMIGKDRTLISKIRRGLVRPTLDVAADIESKTGGAVPMQSWILAEYTPTHGVAA